MVSSGFITRVIWTAKTGETPLPKIKYCVTCWINLVTLLTAPGQAKLLIMRLVIKFYFVLKVFWLDIYILFFWNSPLQFRPNLSPASQNCLLFIYCYSSKRFTVCYCVHFQMWYLLTISEVSLSFVCVYAFLPLHGFLNYVSAGFVSLKFQPLSFFCGCFSLDVDFKKKTLYFWTLGCYRVSVFVFCQCKHYFYNCSPSGNVTFIRLFQCLIHCFRSFSVACFGVFVLVLVLRTGVLV